MTENKKDPENRKKEDILKALKVINFFSSHFNVILGLNLKEAKEIAVILNVIGPNTLISLDKLTEKIYDKLSIYSVVIHPVKEASTICNGLYHHTPGPYEPNPKLTTGAGDNFNAGFCLGLALGLSPNLSLVLGTATSGYYVRNGQSPTLEEEIEFLKTWQESL